MSAAAAERALFRQLARECSLSVSEAGVDLMIAMGLMTEEERADEAAIYRALGRAFELTPKGLPNKRKRAK
jgi:hypothetical protein